MYTLLLLSTSCFLKVDFSESCFLICLVLQYCVVLIFVSCVLPGKIGEGAELLLALISFLITMND